MASVWIGTDESGKGDYFGPLVVAAVEVDEQRAAQLAKAGVRDSKRLSIGRAHGLARTIASLCIHRVVSIGPERYNQLYASMRNLNRLLAWAHARAIEDLLSEVSCERVLVDKFAAETVLEEALMQRGSQAEVVQMVRAEEDMAVAAASVLARSRFRAELDSLSAEFSINLAAGAGPPVLEAGRAFIAHHGAAALGRVAKLHFKTSKSLGLS